MFKAACTVSCCGATRMSASAVCGQSHVLREVCSRSLRYPHVLRRCRRVDGAPDYVGSLLTGRASVY